MVEEIWCLNAFLFVMHAGEDFSVSPFLVFIYKKYSAFRRTIHNVRIIVCKITARARIYDNTDEYRVATNQANLYLKVEPVYLKLI